MGGDLGLGGERRLAGQGVGGLEVTCYFWFMAAAAFCVGFDHQLVELISQHFMTGIA